MNTIVQGKRIADEVAIKLQTRIAASGSTPALDIVVVGTNPVTDSFVRAKKNFAEKIGATCNIHNFPETIQEAKLLDEVQRIQMSSKALIIQLPLPIHISENAILLAVAPEKDVDVLNEATYQQFQRGDTNFIPPVAGAIVTILQFYDIPICDTTVAIVGKGRLVGAPTAELLRQRGAHVHVLDSKTPHQDFVRTVGEAAIVITGVGKAGIIEPDMLSQGVVLIDAGTSTKAQVLCGDAEPECSEKAALFSPTPGGVGPVTVATLFENVVQAWV